MVPLDKFVPELVWKRATKHCEEAELLNPDGTVGVTFELTLRPTCYRRGPYRLLIRVHGGPFHHHWGCFDAQDQPERNYHLKQNAISEANAIARVLQTDFHDKPASVIDQWYMQYKIEVEFRLSKEPHLEQFADVPAFAKMIQTRLFDEGGMAGMFNVVSLNDEKALVVFTRELVDDEELALERNPSDLKAGLIAQFKAELDEASQLSNHSILTAPQQIVFAPCSDQVSAVSR